MGDYRQYITGEGIVVTVTFASCVNLTWVSSTVKIYEGVPVYTFLSALYKVCNPLPNNQVYPVLCKAVESTVII